MKKRVLKVTEEQHNFKTDFTQKCLDANKHNHATTTYYLFLKRLEREGKLPGGITNSGNSSDEEIDKIDRKKAKAASEKEEIENDGVEGTTVSKGSDELSLLHELKPGIRPSRSSTKPKNPKPISNYEQQCKSCLFSYLSCIQFYQQYSRNRIDQ